MNEFNWPLATFIGSNPPALLASPLTALAARVGLWGGLRVERSSGVLAGWRRTAWERRLVTGT